MKRIALGLGLVVAASALVGCTTHHRVTDPNSGKTYYTTDLKTNRHGAVEFTDGRSGSRVTLQNSEVQKVSKQDYHDGTGNR